LIALLRPATVIVISPDGARESPYLAAARAVGAHLIVLCPCIDIKDTIKYADWKLSSSEPGLSVYNMTVE